jgi:hypothetical protein
MNNHEAEVPWAQSRAKEILKNEILIGNVTESTNYADVYYSNPEYQKYPKERFRSNMKNLITAIAKKESRANFETNAAINDVMMFPRPDFSFGGYPFWDTSEAAVYLEFDIKQGSHLIMSIKELYNARNAYQMFPQDVFRKHVHQKVNAKTQKSYWMKKKQNK